MNSKTKVISATCESGKVFVNGAEVPQAVVLSAGQEKSTGCAIFSAENVFYVAIPVATLTKLIELLSTLIDTLSSGVLPKNGGGPITADTFSAGLTALKVALMQLKGGMQ